MIQIILNFAYIYIYIFIKICIPRSGRVKALWPNKCCVPAANDPVPIIDEMLLLLMGRPTTVGLLSAGSFKTDDDSVDGETVSDRRTGDVCVAGLTCQVLGGGGVSDSEVPEADRRLAPIGGVPIANCTDGGEIELIDELLFLCSDRFMLMGCERGMELDCSVFWGFNNHNLVQFKHSSDLIYNHKHIDNRGLS